MHMKGNTSVPFFGAKIKKHFFCKNPCNFTPIALYCYRSTNYDGDWNEEIFKSDREN